MVLLIARQFGDRDALELAFLAAEADARLVRHAAPHERFLALLLVEHLIELVRRLGLRPEDVAGMIRLFVESLGRVAVEDRPAEGDVFAVLPSQRIVMCRPVITNSNFLRARLAEDGDAVLLAVAARIVLELLVDPRVPLGVDDPLEDAADEVLLVLGVEVVVDDVVVGDVPVVGDARPQQAALRILVIPGKADRLALLGRERVVTAPSRAIRASEVAADLGRRLGFRPHAADGQVPPPARRLPAQRRPRSSKSPAARSCRSLANRSSQQSHAALSSRRDSMTKSFLPSRRSPSATVDWHILKVASPPPRSIRANRHWKCKNYFRWQIPQ